MAHENIPETQTQTQDSSHIFSNMDSQPIGNIIWGRLYGKNIKLKSLDLFQEEFRVGRAETNDLWLGDKDIPAKIRVRISKTHFQITRKLGDLSNPVFIQDMSRNGTFVNEEKLGYNTKRILLNDDVISISHPLYKAFVFKDLGLNERQGLPPEIYTQYYISRKLGSGACGLVRLVYDVRTCQEYAMKCVQKNLLSEATNIKHLNDPDRVMNEVKILKSLEHPCVIKMRDIVDKPDSVFMILEYMKGGDLLSRIISNRRLSERISKLYFYQICHAIKYLHAKGITHRDIKPDNILLETEDEETLIKVSDFGLSKFVRKDSVMRTLCGTPTYVAPEILITQGRGFYTEKVDIWSLGVLLYTCLSGTLPFSDDYGSPATEQIKKGTFTFSHPSWRNISAPAKALILRMLTVNPNQRPSIKYVLNHIWLKDAEIIAKANSLMKWNSLESGDEDFLEPPIKRLRR